MHKLASRAIFLDAFLPSVSLGFDRQAEDGRANERADGRMDATRRRAPGRAGPLVQ